MLDDILEFIVELLLEGVVEAAGSKKVPRPVRIALGAVIAMVVIGIFALLLAAGIRSGSVALVVLAGVFVVGIAWLAIVKIRKHIDGQ